MKRLTLVFAILVATQAAYAEEKAPAPETTVVSPSPAAEPTASAASSETSKEAEKAAEKKTTPPETEWVHPTK